MTQTSNTKGRPFRRWHGLEAEGRREEERAALVGLTLDPDAATHESDQVRGDAEAEARPTVLACGRAVSLHEGIEDIVQLFGRDADE